MPVVVAPLGPPPGDVGGPQPVLGRRPVLAHLAAEALGHADLPAGAAADVRPRG
ncbi:hypothetical protein ACIPJS_10425 [Streptomyces sp. NPDC086783]|uniref:hypothetical protein n=1 Tax=Streptomyces sp. NPDC086783 TaxID=3365758 RepID=UPI0038092A02